MGKDALVVGRDILFGEGSFHGFLSVDERDFISVILANHSYHPRGEELENDASLQQIIPYVWIVNPFEKKVFLYKRGVNQKKETGEYKERRYLNKYSGGVGGHIDRDTEEGADNPIQKAMMRELHEEVEFVGGEYPIPKIFGYLNDEDNIGKVHFGVVAVAECLGEVRTKEGEGLSNGAFYSIKEVDSLFADSQNEVESWTRLSWPYIRKFIERSEDSD